MTRKKRDPKKMVLAQAILDTYPPETTEDMNNALKDLFGPMFEAMHQGEMNYHLGYNSNDKGPKKDDDRRHLCFQMSHDMISVITDCILPELEEWENQPLKKCYAFSSRWMEFPDWKLGQRLSSPKSLYNAASFT